MPVRYTPQSFKVHFQITDTFNSDTAIICQTTFQIIDTPQLHQRNNGDNSQKNDNNKVSIKQACADGVLREHTIYLPQTCYHSFIHNITVPLRQPERNQIDCSVTSSHQSDKRFH